MYNKQVQWFPLDPTTDYIDFYTNFKVFDVISSFLLLVQTIRYKQEIHLLCKSISYRYFILGNPHITACLIGDGYTSKNWTFTLFYNEWCSELFDMYCLKAKSRSLTIKHKVNKNDLQNKITTLNEPLDKVM